MLVVVLVVTGCSPIMRPPSPAAFMESYERGNSTINMNLSLYGGELLRDSSVTDEEAYDEWVFDVTGSAFYNRGFFSCGLGLQTSTLFAQLGFVSPYVGVMGWSSIFFSGISAGGMLVQQIPIGESLKLGFSEHFSRNGVEYDYEVPAEGFMIPTIPEPRPKFYKEVGGGFFVTYNGWVTFEFRYGRDLDYHRNRFAVTFSMFTDAKIMKDNSEKMKREQELQIQEENERELRRKKREQESLEAFENMQD